jgi:RNA polymerase sigma-70 factor (ECF subfamily)
MLIALIAAGDKRALEALYIRHHGRVQRFLMRLVKDESVAEELVDEVFLAIWRHADQFEAKSSATTWMLSIARHKAISELRRHADVHLDEKVAASIEDASDGPALTMDKHDRSAVVAKCLEKLSPQHREVINLVYYQDKKIGEVAKALDAPINTVKSRMHYARNRMAELLTEVGVDGAWAAI